MPSTDSFHPHPCIQSLKGAAAFSDPTKGGAVPAGREAAPCVFFTCCKNEKYHPSSKPNGYKQWFRRLRSSFRPSALKTGISADTLDGCDILVMGAPQSKFTIDEFNALKDFIHRGGSLFILADEGGEESLGTNINYLLEEYGISVNSDATVRIVPSDDYIHPKETLITDGVLNRSIQRFVEKSKVSSGRENEAPGDLTTSPSMKLGGAPLRFVTPHGATLNVQKPAVPVLSTGKLVFPFQRPVAALWAGDHKKGEGRGKVAVLGAGRMADDTWLDKEDNAKVLDFVLRWLSPSSDLKLYALDAEEPDVSEYEPLPNVAALAERAKISLNDSAGSHDLSKGFTSLFLDQMFAMDMDLIPEAVDLYAQLGVKKKPLELIAPQFETPTPKLHPAVFPPALRDLAPPPLDLFDLEEEFSGAQHKLNALFQRCQGGSDEDLRVFIEEGARICGVGGEGDVGDGNSADAALIAAFRKMVQLKTRSDDFDGEEQGEEDEW